MMRTTEDLRRAFDAVGTSPVDTDGMLVSIGTRIEARRTRRRQATILVTAAAAAMIAITPVVVSTLDGDQPTGGQVAAAPDAPDNAPGNEESAVDELADPARTELGFSLRERPAGYASEYATIQPNLQSLHFYPDNSPNTLHELVITLFDPRLSGQSVPDPTGETVVVESVVSGPLTVQVVRSGTNDVNQPRFAVAWQVANGSWLTISSDAPGDLARQEVLAVAAQLDLGETAPLTFAFHIGYVPEGFDVHDASRAADEPAGLDASLGFDDRTQTLYEPSALTVLAMTPPGVPDEYSPANTTVGAYPAWLSGPDFEGRSIMLFDVEGFRIIVNVSQAYVDRISDAEMRRVAESISVVPGSVGDETLWTEQPLG